MVLTKLSGTRSAPSNGKAWINDTIISDLIAAFNIEARDPQPVTTADEIPFKYEYITKEWLTAVLAKEHPGAEVTSCQLGPPDPGTTNRRRISMSWNKLGVEAGLPESVFCKGHQDLNQRLNEAWGGIECECAYFNHLRPLLKVEAPVGLFATFDPISFNAITIMKDLSDTVQFCEYYTPVTRKMVESQLYLAATMHGQFYMSQDEALNGLISFGEFWDAYCETVGVEGACRNGWIAGENVIPESIYKRGIEEIWPLTIKSAKRNAQLPYTFTQSDCHLGNWYLTKDGTMGLQDYQTAGRGAWQRDLAYILSTGPSTEDRCVWEKELMRYYLDVFEKSGGPRVSEEDAWEEVRLQTLTVLGFWTLTLTPSDKMPPGMQKKECAVFNIKKISAAMEDWKVLDVEVEE